MKLIERRNVKYVIKMKRPLKIIENLSTTKLYSNAYIGFV
jgi:hypothetical protein